MECWCPSVAWLFVRPVFHNPGTRLRRCSCPLGENWIHPYAATDFLALAFRESHGELFKGPLVWPGLPDATPSARLTGRFAGSSLINMKPRRQLLQVTNVVFVRHVN